MEPASQKETSPLDLLRKSIHCLTKSFRFLFPNAKNMDLAYKKMMWSYVMEPICLLCPTTYNLCEIVCLPTIGRKEARSLTSSTTSRACSAPSHYIISIICKNALVPCCLLCPTRLRLYPQYAVRSLTHH